MCGDIEVNPGPDSVEDSNSSSETLSATSFETLSNHLCIFHLNIQSIVPKIDIIRSESDAYDVLVLSESWLKPNITDETIKIDYFQPPFRTDRVDRSGGGVVLYVRDTILCKRRADLEVQGLEAVWVELQIKRKRILVGGFYKPPNSNSDYFDLLKESVDSPIYTNERQTCLPNNLRTFTTKDLLFGCENASEQDNQSLFLQVQDFIVNSGRFP